jgi:hypothetical protein
VIHVNCYTVLYLYIAREGCYRLEGRGSIPDRGKKYVLLHGVQTGSGAHPAFTPVASGGCFLGGKAVGV